MKFSSFYTKEIYVSLTHEYDGSHTTLCSSPKGDTLYYTHMLFHPPAVSSLYRVREIVYFNWNDELKGRRKHNIPTLF